MNPQEHQALEMCLDTLTKEQADAILFKIQQIHGSLVSPQPANGYFILGTFAERLAGIIRKFPCCVAPEAPQAPEVPEAPVEEVQA
jgi:hypothetical protein